MRVIEYAVTDLRSARAVAAIIAKGKRDLTLLVSEEAFHKIIMELYDEKDKRITVPHYGVRLGIRNVGPFKRD